MIAISSPPTVNPIQRKDRVLRMELPGCQLERLRDALDDIHAIQHLEDVGGNVMRFADGADNGRFDSLRKMSIQSRGFDLFDHMLHLLRCGIGFHNDHHSDFSFGLFGEIGTQFDGVS